MTQSLLALLKEDRPLIMGILNATPDSFSDGGRYTVIDAALSHVMDMVSEGADIIDVGGESTRPGAMEVSAKDEIQRVVPLINKIRQQTDVCISIDTSKPEVMRAAVDAGANFINDVNGLRAEGALEICAALKVPVCVMHMQGKPRTMQQAPQYENVLNDVKNYLHQRVDACIEAGISRDKVIVDPGFGFGKSLQHNLQLLNGLEEFQSLDLPVLVGFSRKSMLGAILGDAPSEERLHASLAAAVLAWVKGVRILRVHDVRPTSDALKVCLSMQAVTGK